MQTNTKRKTVEGERILVIRFYFHHPMTNHCQYLSKNFATT